MTKDSIFDLVTTYSGQLDIHGIYDKLELSTTEDFIKLNRILQELEDEYQIGRNSKDHFCLLKDLNLYRGMITINRKGYGFLDIDEGSIFVPERKLNTAMNNDEVIVKKIVTYDQTEGEVIKVLKRNTTHIVGTFVVRKQIYLKPDDSRLGNTLIVDNLKDYHVVDGMKVYCKVLRYGESIVVRIESILGHVNDPGVDILGILLDHGICPEFPEEVLEEAQRISDYVTDEQKLDRTDLTERTIVTIDGEDAKDLDDAISIERKGDGYLLGVHIADVSSYVIKDSMIDKEARKRGTSVYVVDRVVPMLPHVLSNGICSLNPHVERCTITCDMEVNNEGEVTNYSIYPSFIKSNERMTYTKVNKILDDDSESINEYKHLGDIFQLMKDCSSNIRRKRKNQGAIDFDKDEAKIILNERGKVKDIVLRERHEAERIIEDFMILANECVAAHTKWLEIPSLYRVHGSPSVQKSRELIRLTKILGYSFKGNVSELHPLELQKCLDYFRDTESYPVIATLMLRTMEKARYDSKCIGHFGLASDEYTHFTSPIRRYPDLVVHRELRKYYFNQESDLKTIASDEELMEVLGNETSVSERMATDAERAVDDLKKAEYMKNHIGEIYDGIISGIAKFGFFVQLNNTVEGLVSLQSLSDDYYIYDPSTLTLIGQYTNRRFSIGQRVKIRVDKVDLKNQEIDFRLFTSKSEKRQRRFIKRYR